MDFYQQLSKYYHHVFPTGQIQLNFLLKELLPLKNMGKILDVACGDGGYSLELAKQGFQVVGFDLSPGMVQVALENQKRLEDNTQESIAGKTEFRVGDMRYAHKLGQEFAGLFCIGNSLAHLINDDDLIDTVNNFYGALKDGGTAIVQIVNFDYMVNNKVPNLATISNQEIVFERKYHYREDGLIDFNTWLTVKESGSSEKTYKNSVVLKPLFVEHLDKLFYQAGFKSLDHYGAYDGREYKADSPATIIVAKS